MTKSSTVHIGMDVHKASIEIALAEPGALGEVGQYDKVVGDLASLDRAIRWSKSSSDR